MHMQNRNTVSHGASNDVIGGSSGGETTATFACDANRELRAKMPDVPDNTGKRQNRIHSKTNPIPQEREILITPPREKIPTKNPENAKARRTLQMSHEWQKVAY